MQPVGLVVSRQLAKGMVVEGDEHVGEFLKGPESGSKRVAVDFPKRMHERVPVLSADFPVFVPMAVVKTRLCMAHNLVMSFRDSGPKGGLPTDSVRPGGFLQGSPCR